MKKPPISKSSPIPGVHQLNRMLGLNTGDVLQRPMLIKLKTHPLPKIRLLANKILDSKGWNDKGPMSQGK